MSIERPDVKPRLDHDVHAMLKVFARLDGVSIAEWCELVITAAVHKRASDATVAAAELQRLGILGKSRESPGGTGKGHK